MSPRKRDGARQNSEPVPVEAVEHPQERRANIPTEELRDFVSDDENAPPAELYPRDPSLDPQLVWKGKDEQDAASLEVSTVPVYIQETVHPKAIIENLRETATEGGQEPEMTLFDDLRKLDFEQMVDFWQHADRWMNRLILGDSLLVMNSLAEKERLRGKVQTIYIDPPYGIKFGSNWQVSTRKRDVKDGKVTDATRQPEQIRAFRDTWELGIHSYLAYLRDRLTVSRELLTESGSCFVQIGDENVHLVRSLMDEVFGSENFVSQIVLRTTSGAGSPSGSTRTLAGVHDYAIWFARDIEQIKYRQLYQGKSGNEGGAGLYRRVELPDGSERPATDAELADSGILPDGARLFQPDNLTSQSSPESATFAVEFDGEQIRPGKGGWKTNPEGMDRLKRAGRLYKTRRGTLRYIRYLEDFPASPINNVWTDVGTGSFTDPKRFVVQTNTKIIERCLLMTSDPGDLVLDPTCGSGTTAVSAEKLGRRWITIDTSRVALALARTRLMATRQPSFMLVDSREGQRKLKELGDGSDVEIAAGGDIRKGFVYRRVPHIMLSSIARNPDIKDGMSREEIDTAIARHADQELLYDRPYENRKIVRVTGPFTVESLSPHRMLDRDPDRLTETDEPRDGGAPFATTILENLRKAGVQNTVRDEHLGFTYLEPHAGRWVHMRGEFEDPDGATRSVAVSLGPEHGTVGADQVNEAAKEALKGAGADLLLVCAFAFDAHASEEAKEFTPEPGSDSGSSWAVAAAEQRRGKLPVLLVRMNPDLAMGDELLKKTGSGNLFMVFGEPDVLIEPSAENKGGLEVEIRGVDVYDPTTGAVRSSSTDDIACWFIDTDYDAESFYVRHAYFTGADEPYKNLQRALRADIDEEAWASLYRTRSRPFPLPESGRIAVKVINHYGDEVLKVYEVGGAEGAEG